MTKKQKELINNVRDMYEEEGMKEFRQYIKDNNLMLTVYEANPDNPFEAHVKCYDCGFEGVINATTQETCPNCGKKISKGNSPELIYNKVIYTEEYLLLLRYVTEIRATIDNCEVDMSLSNIVKFDATINDLLCFENCMGEWCKRMPTYAYRYYYDYKVFSNMTKEKEAECVKLFPKLTKHIPTGGTYDKMTTSYEWNNMHYRIADAYKNAIRYKDMEKVVKSKKMQDIPEIELPELDVKELIENTDPPTSFETKQEGLVWVAICRNCGERVVLPERYMSVQECPHCKRKIANETQHGNAIKTKLEEDGSLMIVLYDYSTKLTTQNEKYQYEVEKITAEAVIYATEKSIYFYKYEKGLKKSTCNEINHFFHYINGGYTYFKIKFIGGVQKVIDDYKNSILKRTGYIEFCESLSGAKDTSDPEVLNAFAKELAGRINYFAIFNSCKALEQLAKSGMTNLLKDIISKVTCPRYIHKKETTPHKILGITKAQFKELREANVNQTEFESYKKLLEADPTALYSDCTRFLHTYYSNSVDTVIDILNYNIPKVNMKEVEKYVESLDQYQCMDWVTGLTEWRDYLNMCITLKCDLNERTVIFTNSLKLEHDRAVRKFNTLKDKKAVENFQEAVKLYQYLEWEHDDFDFMVVTPKTQEELYEEGRILHHCVGSYAKSVAEGRSTIIFIRRKDKPTEPLCTVEVSNNRLVQARTKYNSHAYTVPGVKKFMQAWAKEKHISLLTR